ncbi:MAG: TRAP transporter small permease [Synergistaceae bacterium]|jgi:TRAP-type C4-dicarboxylate transport system permease small subunit|nr:TRAP transporter small permease [Synergistaceae bacterium]
MKKLIENLDEYVLMTMLAFSTTLIFLQVVMRYVFGNSLSWSEELARYLYVWQTWVASSYAVKRGRHLRITSLADKTSQKSRVVVEIAVLAIWLAFSIFLCYIASSLCRKIFNQGQVSSAMGLPMWIAYLAVPTGTVLMSFRLVQQLARNIAKLKTFADAN